MIKSITFKDPNLVKLPEDVHPAYVYYLETIRGRKFEFKPGLNIVCGRNGSGKTSLLDVIRHLTFCDGMLGTNIQGMEHWRLHYEHLYEQGHWHLAEMVAQYTASTFNLRKSEEVREANDIMGFEQIYVGLNNSKGESAMHSIMAMMRYQACGDGTTETAKDSEFGDQCYFEKMALEPIRNEIGKWDIGFETMFKDMLSYYEKNGFRKDDPKNNPYLGFTILMDEPDAGLDIYNVSEIYNFLDMVPPHYQQIVSLHNAGMIHKLAKRGDVNFVELTPGYVDEVEKFFGGGK